MPELTLVQLPFSLNPMPERDIRWLLDDFQTRATAWPPQSVVVQQLAAQMRWELDRRRHNEDPDHEHIEQRMVEFCLDDISPQQACLALTTFNTRSKDENDMPARTGELIDSIVDVMIGIVQGYLMKAYPDSP